MKMKTFDQRQRAPRSCVAEIGWPFKMNNIYLAVNNTAPLFYGLVSTNGQEKLNGHIKKKRLFNTFSYKKLRQFDCLVY